MGNTIEHLDSLFIVHVAADTLQVASSQPTRRCTCATNARHPHLCLVPSQSQANHHRHMILHRSLPHGYNQEKEAWHQFDKLVAKYKGDWHAKDFNCYNQLLYLLFGQLTGCGSLRDICLCFEVHKNCLYHLGIQKAVTHSTVSRANENRDYRIYEELGLLLIDIVRPKYSKTTVFEITIDNVLYALDSTTISTSTVLAAWAFGKYSKVAVKMHTLLDLRGSIPASIHITDVKWHDGNELAYHKTDNLQVQKTLS